MTTERDILAPYLIEPGDGEPISGQGVLIKATTEQTGGQASVLEIASSGFGGPPLHAHHRHDEMCYVLEGEYLIQIGDAVSVAPAGTFILFPRGIPHTFASRGTVPGRLLAIGIPGGLETYVRELDRLMGDGAGDEAVQRLNNAWDTEFVGPPLSL
jgi:mannose-6-phosphate isomerase-like protein (cupin superfamily)